MMQMDVTYRGSQAELAELLRTEAGELTGKRRPTRLDEAEARGLERAASIVDHWVNEPAPVHLDQATASAGADGKPAGKAK
jgi:hypothetical protein